MKTCALVKTGSKGSRSVGLFRAMFMLVMLLAALFGSAGDGAARLSEPDVVYFGVLTGGSAGSFIKLKLDADGSTLASAVVDMKLGFVLRVPMDTLDPRDPGTARSGDSASLYLGETVVRKVVIPTRGSLINLPLAANAPTLEDWQNLHPGDSGSGDMNRNGSSDLQDFLNGNDPQACIWTEVDDGHRETRIYHARVLQNCLSEAQTDGRHNLLKVATGTYFGNFTYFAGADEEFDLLLIGGYDPSGTAASGARLTTEPTGTVLVGDADRDESRNGRVLDMSAGSGQSASRVRVEAFRIIYGGTEWNSDTDRYATNGLEGGGVRLQTDRANLELVGNMFSDNFAYVGGAVFVASTGPGSVLLAGNIISNNAAFNSGGVMVTSSGSGAVTLLNNTIVDNWAENEGEGDSVLIESLSAPVELTNNIIRGIEIGASDIALLRKGAEPFPLAVRSNNLPALSLVKTDIAGFVPDASNITAAPLFIKQQTNAFYYFPTDGNYRLLASSPGVDSGSQHQLLPATDPDGRGRITGAAVDIGAYERPLTDDHFYASPAALIDPIVHTELIADGFVDRVLATNLVSHTIHGRIQGPEGIGRLTVSESSADGGYTPWQVIPLNADNSFTFEPGLMPGLNWLHFEVTKADNAKVMFWYLILVDTTAPGVTLDSAAAPRTNSAPIPVRVTFSKPVSGFTADDIVVANGIITPASFSGSMAEYRFSVTPAADGTVSVDVPAGAATDAAGNSNQAAARLTRVYDTAAPGVTLTSSLPAATYVAPIPVTVSFSEAVTPLDEAKLAVQNGSVSSFAGTAAGYTFNVTPSGIDVVVTVDIAAGAVRDLAGNASSAAVQLVRHYAPPIIILPTLPRTTVSLPAGSYRTPIALTMTATENAAIYYTLDGSAPTAASQRYAGETITVAQNTTLRFFAMDSAGNREEPGSYAYVIDNLLPSLTLSTLTDGKATNNATLNIAGVASDNDGIKEVRINDSIASVAADGSFTLALTLHGGANQIITLVTDLAGNEASDTRTIILDQHATALLVTSPADNSKTATVVSTISGTTEADAVVSVTVNGQLVEPVIMTGTGFSVAVTLAVGVNTIEIAAANPAGTVTTVKRSVTCDNGKPSLAILEPNQDIRTNKGSLLVKGTVADSQTSVAVTVNGDVVAVNGDGSFERLLEFSEQMSYPVVVVAKDEAGNETTVQRNVIYDTTAPVFTVPVVSPTNDRSQTVVGSRESGTTLTVVCPTATVGAVTYPTGRSWSVVLSAVSSGTNQLTVTGVDAAGNSGVQTAQLVVGNFYNGAKTVTFEAPAGMTIFYTTDGTPPTTGSLRYTGPITLNETTTLRYFAVDGLGNSSQVVTAVYSIDTAPPVLTMAALPNGATTTSALFTIAGTVTDNTRVSGLTINGTVVPLADSGGFSTAMVLQNGANTITTVATDLVGNSTTDTRTVTYKAGTAAGPTLTVSTLSAGRATNITPLNVTGMVTDAGGIASLTVNGEPVAVAADGTYSHAVPFAAAGNRVITVVAVNTAGDSTTDSRTITYDPTLPQLTVTTPADNSRTKDAILTITGSGDPGVVQLSNITTNSSLQAVRAGSAFSGSLPLTNGSNTVEVTILGGAGQELTSVKRTVAYDPDLPELAVTSPLQDSITSSGSYLLKGTVFDYGDAALAMTVDGVSLTPAPVVINGAFQQAVTLTAEKSHSVVVTATNGVGTATTVQRNIIYREILLTDVLRAFHIAMGVIGRDARDDLLDVAPLVQGKPAPDGLIDISDAAILLRRLVGLVSW